jgi:hypothetical protein
MKNLTKFWKICESNYWIINTLSKLTKYHRVTIWKLKFFWNKVSYITKSEIKKQLILLWIIKEETSLSELFSEVWQNEK